MLAVQSSRARPSFSDIPFLFPGRTASGETRGKPVWRFHVGQLIHASPMAYVTKGKQYFAIAAAGDLFAFALP
jgi:hypothetical protein